MRVTYKPIRYAAVLLVGLYLAQQFYVIKGRAVEATKPQSLREALQKRKVNIDGLTEQRSCGIESLYLLLRLHEIPCSFELIKDKVAIYEKGSSVRDIQSAAGKMGLELKCVQCGPDELDRIPVPAIAHMEPSPETSFVNHFVVILGVQNDTVILVDPVDNGIHEMPRWAWAHVATGYYLAPTTNLFGWGLSAAWLATGMVILVPGFWKIGKTMLSRSRACVPGER